MIGKAVASKILDNAVLEFYKYPGKVPALLQDVRQKLDDISATWSDEEKERCLGETGAAFQYGGKILSQITS